MIFGETTRPDETKHLSQDGQGLNCVARHRVSLGVIVNMQWFVIIVGAMQHIVVHSTSAASFDPSETHFVAISIHRPSIVHLVVEQPRVLLDKSDAELLCRVVHRVIVLAARRGRNVACAGPCRAKDVVDKRELRKKGSQR